MKQDRTVEEQSTLDSFRGALVFSAVGDALGWPTEFIRYPKQVVNRFGTSYLENYVTWEKTVGGRFWGYRDVIREGEYSDDTQLTLAVYRCLNESGDFEPDKLAYFELPLWLHYQRGGGRSIKASARRLNSSSKEWSKNFYETKDLTYRSAGANGAAMRVLPIALVNIHKEGRLFRDAFINSIVTHGHPRAILGALIYSSAIKFLVTEGSSRTGLIDCLRDTLEVLPEHFRGDRLVGDWVEEWDKKPLDGMRFREVFRSARDEAVAYLGSVRSKINSNDIEFYNLTAALSKGRKGSGISTVLVAIYLFSKYSDDPDKAVLTAVNMLRSDTDTIASFLGGLLGAYHGLSAVPNRLFDRLQDKEYMLGIAEHLYGIATGSPHGPHVLSERLDRSEAYLRILAWEIGLHEMFWGALDIGNSVVHPALGRGSIKEKREEPLKRQGYKARLITIAFQCGQTCVFHSRISETGELSESLAQDTTNALRSLRQRRTAAGELFPTRVSPLREICEAYYVPETMRSQIEIFLQQHQNLLAPLLDARRRIATVFGDSIVSVSLEVHRDSEEGWEGLFVVVKTKLSPEGSLDLLDKFDELYWLDVNDAVSELVEVVVR